MIEVPESSPADAVLLLDFSDSWSVTNLSQRVRGLRFVGWEQTASQKCWLSKAVSVSYYTSIYENLGRDHEVAHDPKILATEEFSDASIIPTNKWLQVAGGGTPDVVEYASCRRIEFVVGNVLKDSNL